MKKTVLSIIFLVALNTIASAHNGEQHEKQGTTAAQSDSTHHKEEPVHENHEHPDGTDSEAEASHQHSTDENISASIDEFPHIHPLIVHFPIVLLIVAAFLGVANILFRKKEIDWIITLTVFIGFAGAYASSKWFHPHTHGLSERAQLVLQEHDFWAYLTVYLSLAGFIVQVVSQFVLKQKRWAIAAVAVILISTAYAITHAGHYGAQLVHIEGVGPQGKYLESDGHH